MDAFRRFGRWFFYLGHDPAIKAFRTFVAVLAGVAGAGAIASGGTNDLTAGQAYGFGWKAIILATIVEFLKNFGEELGRRLWRVNAAVEPEPLRIDHIGRNAGDPE